MYFECFGTILFDSSDLKKYTELGTHKNKRFEVNDELKQAIRAKRKRHFNAEQVHTKKKSIDLDYRVWEKLSNRANELGCTLSDAIEYLLSEASRSEKASMKVSSLKEDLSKLLSS